MMLKNKVMKNTTFVLRSFSSPLQTALDTELVSIPGSLSSNASLPLAPKIPSLVKSSHSASQLSEDFGASPEPEYLSVRPEIFLQLSPKEEPLLKACFGRHADLPRLQELAQQSTRDSGQ